MSAKAELPKYKSHKEVWALKIEAIKVVPSGAELLPTDNRFTPIKVSNAYCTKHKPEAGGYYVLYKDGYESYSPSTAFEEGYTLIDGGHNLLSDSLKDIQDRVTDILCDCLAISKDQVLLNAHLEADLGMDSLDRAEIDSALELEFDIKIYESESSVWLYVHNVVGAIAGKLADKQLTPRSSV